ncbi:TonB-dependent receptor plug domain-containing protein [Pedobacter sp. HMF7647]|uniref:TonB-dependent receptor plug domain-containing protein n=1 Tax=Hufsiella arboris TaxID=2695275 RepID=A0A7K1Y4E7_9SPHI|nr:carboxypeptidase regulatory-like domain-containing protein [Hufsiella arboris]MXV49452.1 TonB-dependent receptor plug domain-containing protein [Hufsiella arboris]
MKKRILSLGGIVACILLLVSFTGDDDPIKNLFSKLDKFRSEYPQEKVYLHLDKPYYSIGDTIWFKAYTVNANGHMLSALNKIIYVDLISEKDSIKKTLKLPLNAGMADGNFSLTDSLTEGNYRIRAYTNWMRNFDDEFFFDKTIQIGNAFSNDVITNTTFSFSKEGIKERVDADIAFTNLAGQALPDKDVSYNVVLGYKSIARGKTKTDPQGHAKLSFINTQPFVLKTGKINLNVALGNGKSANKILPVKNTSSDIDLQFMPESGQLVKGLRSKVGFKAVSADGLGADISGYVIDQDKNKITDFKSDYAGIGSFALSPEQGKSYTAVAKLPDGSEKTFDLPKVAQDGYVLSVSNNSSDSLYLRVTASPSLTASGKEIIVLGQSNAEVTYIAKSVMQSNGGLTARIPKGKFPEGITHFTVFDSEQKPVAERIVFIRHPNEHLKVAVSPGKKSYAKRENTKLEISVSDENGKPVQGAFSLAVTDESKVPFDDDKRTTIFSSLLLSSDLKGYIQNPNYYFTKVTTDKDRQLDNLLLTQGWTRFNWKNLLANNYTAINYKPEQGITISGTVKSLGGAPVPGGKVTLFATNGNGTALDTLTDKDGRFKFENLVFTDETRFVVQARNEKGKKNVEITVDQMPAALISKNKNAADAEINLGRDFITYLQNSQKQFAELKKYGVLNRSILLSEVKIVEKKPILKNSSNLNGAGFADAIVKADQLQNYTDLAQALQGRVAGLIIRGGIPYLMRSYNTPMQLILDGMYMDAGFLTSINVQDVESIEVLKSVGNTAIYGSRGGGGVLVINTKRGDGGSSMSRPVPGITSYSPKGYTITKEFYSPKYDKPAVSEMPDLRTTVYWRPNIVTDEKGKAKVEFYNSDGSGNMRVIIEGLDLDGRLAHQEIVYSVN